MLYDVHITWKRLKTDIYAISVLTFLVVRPADPVGLIALGRLRATLRRALHFLWPAEALNAAPR